MFYEVYRIKTKLKPNIRNFLKEMNFSNFWKFVAIWYWFFFFLKRWVLEIFILFKMIWLKGYFQI